MIFPEYTKIDSLKDTWDIHWTKSSIDKNKIRYLRYTKLGRFFLKYIPKNESIIEAGCGIGKWLYFNYLNGFDIIGVDYSEVAIESTKTNFPMIKTQIQDVRKLNFPDNTFGGYISLGVIEHFVKGPYNILKEAKRVVKPDGILVFTVPYYNFFRKNSNKWKKRIRSGEEFYQYFFDKDSLRTILEKFNFEIIHLSGFNSQYGIKEVFGLNKSIGEKVKINELSYQKKHSKVNQSYTKNLINNIKLFGRIALQLPIIDNVCGHLLLAVCRNK